MLAEAEILRSGQQPNDGTKLKWISDLVRGIHHDRVPVSFDEIQQTLKEEVGATLNRPFAESLGFDWMSWQLVYDEQALPLLFVGTHLGYDSTIAIEGAQGIVEIERRVDRQRKVVPSSLRIAGVTNDSDATPRVQAIAFSSLHHKLIRLDLSVSDEEFPLPPKNGVRDKLIGAIPQCAYYNATRSIPSDPESATHTSSFITSAMSKVAGHKIVLHAYDPVPEGQNVAFQDSGAYYKSLTRYQGFTIQKADSAYVISFNPRVESGLKPWMLSFPRSMVRS